jgi:hypothetical protein
MLVVDDPIQSAIRTILYLKAVVGMGEGINSDDEKDIKTVIGKLREIQTKRA